MSRFGRRTVYIAGQLSMASVLGVIGILGCVEQKTEVSLAIGSLMVVLNFLFNITVGPACRLSGSEPDCRADSSGYTIVGELPSTRVRAQTIVLARIAYVISSICVNQLAPRMIGEQAWG